MLLNHVNGRQLSHSCNIATTLIHASEIAAMVESAQASAVRREPLPIDEVNA